MGCCASTPEDAGGSRRTPAKIGEVFVYVPGFRIPKPVDFSLSLRDHLNENLVQRLSTQRTRIVALVAQGATTMTMSRRRTSTQHGSILGDLLQAFEDYLPVLLGLVKDDCHLENKVQFVWVNQEDAVEETALSSAWYEVLSVLHLMAILSLSQANFLLIPRITMEGYQPKVSEGNRRASVDIFLKAAGYLDCAIQHVLPRFPVEIRRNLPLDLHEGTLRALCLQALGQGVDIQLGLAIDSTKATMAVKRRLACEMVKCWKQAEDNIMNLQLANGWGEKHKLFISWKHIEAKAAAYYCHGMILDESNTEKSHGMAIAALQAADEYLKEGKKRSDAFHFSLPLSRNPPLWGTIKYLSEKIALDAASKVRINKDLYSQAKISENVSELPDFELALKPDEYQLPSVDVLLV